MAIIASFSFEIYIVHGYVIDILNNAENALGGIAGFLLYTVVGSVLLKVLADFIYRKTETN